MPKDTTQIGQVGKPTPRTVADASATHKKEGSSSAPAYFENMGRETDDIGQMVDRGLPLAESFVLRRLHDGLYAIRSLAMLSNAFLSEAAAQARANEEDKHSYTVISPNAGENLLIATELLAEYLDRDVFELGEAFIKAAAKGGAQ